MGKTAKKIFKGAAGIATLGLSDSLLGPNDDSLQKAAAQQQALMQQQALLQQQQSQQPDIATVLPGADGSPTDPKRKRRTVGGPVSTSLGINV